MRKIITILSATALLTAVLAGSALAGDDDDRRAKRSLVGSWQATVTPGGHTPDDASDDLYPAFANFVTIHRDGTVVNTDTIVASGVGQWERIGKRTYRARILHLAMYDGQFTRLLDALNFTNEGTGYVDVTLELTVSRDGKTASGTYTTEFRTDGGELATFNAVGTNGDDAVASGSIEWKRIEIRDDVQVP